MIFKLAKSKTITSTTLRERERVVQSNAFNQIRSTPFESKEMLLIRKCLLPRNCFRLLSINPIISRPQRPFCSKQNEDKPAASLAIKSAASLAIKSADDQRPTYRQLTSAVVLKSADPDVDDSQRNIDYNIAIKNMEKYDDESQVVYDITDEALEQDEEESKFKYLYQNRPSEERMLRDSKLMERGKEGVFDLDQMVYALEKEKIKDIAVIKIPDDVLMNKCFVIGSARSPKHLASVFEYIAKLYKFKKSPQDKFPHYEGTSSKSWKIIDMDIIMLHLFLEEKREFYDIEQLWTVGAEYDDKCRVKKGEIEEMVEEHAKLLDEKEQKEKQQKEQNS